MTYRTQWLHAVLGVVIATLPALSAQADPPRPAPRRARATAPQRAHTTATPRRTPTPVAAELMNPHTNGTLDTARETGVVRPVAVRPVRGGGPVVPPANTILGDSTARPTTDCTRIAQGGRRAERRGARPVAWNSSRAAQARNNGLELHYCGAGATWRQQPMNDSQLRYNGRQDQFQDTVRLPLLRVRNR